MKRTYLIKSYTKEQIEKAVKNSKSHSEAANLLGISGKAKSLSKWCKKYNISHSHYSTKGINTKYEIIQKKCVICDTTFSVKNNKIGLKRVACSSSCSKKNVSRHVYNHRNKTKRVNCINCDCDMIVSIVDRNDKYCDTCKEILPIHIYSTENIEDRKCAFCGKSFKCRKYKRNKTCSNECYKNNQSLILTGKTGGPRIHGGRGKFSFYVKKNGERIYCQSTYEYKACEIFEELNLNWDRNVKGFPYVSIHGKNRNYYPDFIIYDYNCYVETKGYINEEIQHKMSNSKVPRLLILTSNKYGGCWDDIKKDYNLLIEKMKNLK